MHSTTREFNGFSAVFVFIVSSPFFSLTFSSSLSFIVELTHAQYIVLYYFMLCCCQCDRELWRKKSFHCQVEETAIVNAYGMALIVKLSGGNLSKLLVYDRNVGVLNGTKFCFLSIKLDYSRILDSILNSKKKIKNSRHEISAVFQDWFTQECAHAYRMLV